MSIRVPTSILSEYSALTERAGLVDVSDRTQIEISGSDRVTFLHSFCTNDIKKLQPGQGCEAFLCNGKGKILAYVHVYCRSDSIVLETSPGQSESVVAHLDRYVIREDVRFRDHHGDWSQFLLAGPAAPALIARTLAGLSTAAGAASAAPIAQTLQPPPSVTAGTPAPPLIHSECEVAGVPISLRQARLTGVPGFLISCPTGSGAGASASAVRDAWLASGAEPSSLAALEIEQIEAGIPTFGRDITDDNLPQEIGRTAQTISFTKGCYLGQETVARIDAMGHVNRKLRQFQIEGELVPAAGTELVLDGKSVGRITACVFSPRRDALLALGYVRTPHSAAGTRLEVGVGGGPHAVVV